MFGTGIKAKVKEQMGNKVESERKDENDETGQGNGTQRNGWEPGDRCQEEGYCLESSALKACKTEEKISFPGDGGWSGALKGNLY